MAKKKAKKGGYMEPIGRCKKLMAAHDRLMGARAEDVAEKYSISTKTLSLWENHDDEYMGIVAQAARDIRRATTGSLIKGMAGLSAKVMRAAMAEEGGELGFKILKEMGAFKTSGKELGMTQDEVAQAGGVTIMVMGAVGSDGTPEHRTPS